MSPRVWFLLCFGLALSACSQVGGIAVQDAQQAEALAQASGDTTAPCYAGLAKVAQAAQAVKQLGVLTTVQAKRSVGLALENSACFPIFASALADLLHATPVAPFVP